MLSLHSKLRPDYIVRYIPTAVWVAWQVHSSLAILYDYPGHVGRHVARRGRRQCLFYTAKCRQVAQLVNSGKDKWEFAMFIALQRLGRRNPGAFACLQAIMCRLLLGRCSCEKEVCIEALGHSLGCNPVREVAQVIGGQRQLLGMRHLDQRTFALVERLPVRIKAGHVLLVEGKPDSQRIVKQHTCLLEKFAYGCGPQSRPQRSESFGIGCQWRYRRTDPFRLLRAAVIC